MFYSVLETGTSFWYRFLERLSPAEELAKLLPWDRHKTDRERDSAIEWGWTCMSFPGRGQRGIPQSRSSTWRQNYDQWRRSTDDHSRHRSHNTIYAFSIYTVNHKKRGSLFLTITLANLNQFLYHCNREEILHTTLVKFTTSPNLCAHHTWKN